MSEYATSNHGPRQPLTSQANGYAKPVRSPTWESHDQYRERDPTHLVPDRASELHKKKSEDMSHTDQDSVLEYYKNHTNNKKGPTAVKGKVKKKPTAKIPGPTDADYDENHWIHRDKLKEIETRELEEAGFRVGRSSRSGTRSHKLRVDRTDAKWRRAKRASKAGFYYTSWGRRGSGAVSRFPTYISGRVPRVSASFTASEPYCET
jgi:hypothetical protein